MNPEMTRIIARLEFLRELMIELAEKTIERPEDSDYGRGIAAGIRIAYKQAERQIEIELEAFKLIATLKEPESFCDWPLSKFHAMEVK